MTLDLKGKKVVVTGGKHSVGRAIAQAVAREGADVVIWLRRCDGSGSEAEALSTTQLEVPSHQSNGTSPHTSLWRQSMGTHKS